MTIVLQTNLAPGFAPPPRQPSKLRIFRKQSAGANGPKFGYSFSTMEFVVTDLSNPGLIELSLDMTQMPPNVESMYIHDFCCTRGNSMSAEIFMNEQNRPVTHFGVNTTQVGLKPSLLPKELVSVGLLIAVHERNASKPELILCDPQVGNGPPLPGPSGELIYPAVQLI